MRCCELAGKAFQGKVKCVKMKDQCSVNELSWQELTYEGMHAEVSQAIWQSILPSKSH